MFNNSEPIMIFDLETAGLDKYNPPEEERRYPVIQLGAIIVKDFKVISTFEKKIKFNKLSADPEALRINGYTPERWKDAESLLNVCYAFAHWLKPHLTLKRIGKTGRPYTICQSAGFNTAGFDIKKLSEMYDITRPMTPEGKGIFLPIDWRSLDVLQAVIWYQYLTLGKTDQTLTLDALCKKHDITEYEAHDALGDCYRSWEIFKIYASLLVPAQLITFTGGTTIVKP